MMYGLHELTVAGAEKLDRADPLGYARGRFHQPGVRGPNPVIYLAGNSLGLQLRSVRPALEQRLVEWKDTAVDGWHDTDWMAVDRVLSRQMGAIVGALPEEVAVGGTLTANLHTLLASFYRPSGDRRRILMEESPFPSDRYAVTGHVRWHGLDPSDVIVTRSGNQALLAEIEERGSEFALLLLGGVNYYTGEVFDMKRLVRGAREAGCVAGLDLAHAAGNVRLNLHDWGVDFAAWCGYKYLNGGPGSPAAFFVHQRHHDFQGVRLSGWWGHDLESRFLMPPDFRPTPGAAGWQISTPAILGLAPLEASLALFDEVGMDTIFEKSRKLTGFLDALIAERFGGRVAVVTPADRGAQLSLRVPGGRPTFERLSRQDVVCDWREPDVVRVAPAPLYNTFGEMVVFTDRLETALR